MTCSGHTQPNIHTHTLSRPHMHSLTPTLSCSLHTSRHAHAPPTPSPPHSPLPPPHSWVPCCQVGPVTLTVSEENVRQMPPKPFRDSARNINGDRTGKGRGMGEGIWGAVGGQGRGWGQKIHLHPTHFLVGAREAKQLTSGVPRGQGHEGAGRSEAGAVETQGRRESCL